MNWHPNGIYDRQRGVKGRQSKGGSLTKCAPFFKIRQEIRNAVLYTEPVHRSGMCRSKLGKLFLVPARFSSNACQFEKDGKAIKKEIWLQASLSSTRPTFGNSLLFF